MAQDFRIARDVPGALRILAGLGGRGRVMAGGTDLMLDLQKGKFDCDCIVDISGIEELRHIRGKDGLLEIGAAVTHNEAASHPAVRAGAHALAKASAAVGAYQIRNCSTIAGNIVSAQPAADSAVALVALGAWAEIVGPEGARTALVEDLYAGFGRSKVDSSSSIMTRITLRPAGEGEGSGYARLEQRKALALPMLCVGAFLKVEDGVVRACRLAMGPVGVGPVRAVEAEAYLTGRPATEEAFKEAGRLALRNAAPRDSLIRGSKRYRVAVLPVMVERALAEALEDSRRGGKEALV